MSHTGTWKGRMRMAWASWALGTGLTIAGVVGVFMGHETMGMIVSGVGLVTSVKAIVVGGKVMHDHSERTNKKKEEEELEIEL